MARIRSVKPETWTDEKFVELSPLARLLFIGLWNFADDDGRMVYSPKRIKMQVLPNDDADAAELVGEIRRAAMVDVYVVDGVEYLQICNFAKHQKIDKRRASSLPPPPNCADSRRIAPTFSGGLDQGVDQGVEGKGSAASAREVGETVLAIMAVADDPRWVGSYGRVHQWLADGCDPELDIYPTIRRVMAKRNGQGPPANLKYFDQAIADAKATRLTPLPRGQPGVGKKSDAELMAEIQAAKATAT
jgi:hypothetical protein